MESNCYRGDFQKIQMNRAEYGQLNRQGLNYRCACLSAWAQFRASRRARYSYTKRANCYTLPRNGLLARKWQAELFSLSLFFLFRFQVPIKKRHGSERRVMKIRCSNARCGGPSFNYHNKVSTLCNTIVRCTARPHYLCNNDKSIKWEQFISSCKAVENHA